jgi:hypothetical protein
MAGSKCATEHRYSDEEMEHSTLDITSDDNIITYINEIVVIQTLELNRIKKIKSINRQYGISTYITTHWHM